MPLSLFESFSLLPFMAISLFISSLDLSTCNLCDLASISCCKALSLVLSDQATGSIDLGEYSLASHSSLSYDMRQYLIDANTDYSKITECFSTPCLLHMKPTA